MKITKNILMILCLVFVSSFLVVFTACDEENKALFDVSVEEIEFIYGDDVASKSITITRDSLDVDIWYSLTNKEIVNISKERDIGTSIVYSITPIQTGSTEITFKSSQSSETKTIKVRVVEEVTDATFIGSENGIYLVGGSTYQLNTKDIEVLPGGNLFNQLKFELVGESSSFSVSPSGLIDATKMTTEGTFGIRILKANAQTETVFDTFSVTVLNQIDVNSKIKILNAKTTETIFENGVQNLSIELVKSNENSEISLQVEVEGYRTDEIEYTTEVSGTSLQVSSYDGATYVQAVNVGEGELTFYIVQKVAVNYVEPVQVKIVINVIDLPTTILLNGSKIANEPVYVYDVYDDGYFGTRLTFQSYPSAINDSYADTLQISFLAQTSKNYFRFYKIVNGSAVKLEFTDGVLNVKSGEEVYIWGEKIVDTSESSLKHELKIKSLVAEKYNSKVEVNVSLELKKGIEEIGIEKESYKVAVGSKTKVVIGLVPANSDYSQVTYWTSSSNIELVKVSQNEFYIKGINASRDEYVYFGKPNGDSVKREVTVVSVLESAYFDVEEVEVGNLTAKKNIKVLSGGETVDELEINVKVGKEVAMFYGYNKDATVESVSIVAQGETKNEKGDSAQFITNNLETGVSIDMLASTFKCFKETSFRLELVVIGYELIGEDVVESEIRLVIHCHAFVPLIEFKMNKSSAVCYTLDSVGYYNSELSAVDLYVNYSPTYASSLSGSNLNNIKWLKTDNIGNSTTVGNLSYNANTATFSVSSFQGNEINIIITAMFSYMGEDYSTSCKIRVVNAVQVSQILATNVVNQNIYFDSRKGLGTTNNSNNFTVETIVYPSNALNKAVRFQYRDENGNEVTNDKEKVFSVSSSGKIYPLKAGKARLYICAEDQFSNIVECSRYIIVYITVQDGKSKDTAFSITNAKELKAIETSAEMMSYYYTLSNDIDMSSISNFTGLGSSKNMPFTGYLTGKNSFTMSDENGSNERIVYTYYKIENVNLSYTAKASLYSLTDENKERKTGVGFFYKLSSSSSPYDGQPFVGTVEDLTINYSNFSIDLSKVTSYEHNKGYYEISCGGLCGSAVTTQSLQELYTCIKNVKVNFNTFTYKPGVHKANIGGIVGTLKKLKIENDSSCTGVIVKGSNEFSIYADNQTSDVTHRVNNKDEYSTYNVGGFVGYMENSEISSRFSGIANSSSEITYSSSFELSNIDVSLNLGNTYSNNSVVTRAISSDNSSVGGIVGYAVNSKIANASVENTIKGKNNLGGIAGKISGVEITNCFASSHIEGSSKIGGIVGNIEKYSEESVSKITQTYVQNYYTGAVGKEQCLIYSDDANGTYIGGLVGYSDEPLSITNSYTASYVTQVYINSKYENGFIGDIYSANSNAQVACLIGYYNASRTIGNGDTLVYTLDRCYSNFTCNTSFKDANGQDVATYKIDFACYNLNDKKLSIANSYLENLYNTSLSLPSLDSLSACKNTFAIIRAENNSDKYSIKVVNKEYNTVSLDDVISSEEVESSEGTVLNLKFADVIVGGDIWCVQKGKIPYIKFGESGYNLVEQSPETISLEKAENSVNVIKEEKGKQYLILEYAKSADLSKQTNVEKANTIKISDILQVLSLPADNYQKRYIVTSSNSDIISVTKDGELVIKKVTSKDSIFGSVTLTITSKLNVEKSVTVDVIVIYTTSEIKMNSSSNSNTIDEEWKTLNENFYKGQKAQIYAIVKKDLEVNNEKIEIQNDENIYLEFELAFEDANNSSYKVWEYVALDSSQSENIHTALLNAIHEIIALEQTPSKVKLTVKAFIYVEVNNEKVKLYLDDYFLGRKYGTVTSKVVNDKIEEENNSIGISVKLGATDIEVISSKDVSVSSGEKVVSEVVVYSTVNNEVEKNNKEQVKITVSTLDGLIVASYSNGEQQEKENSDLLIEVIEDNSKFSVSGYYLYTIEISLKDSCKFISDSLSYVVTVSPSTNAVLKDSYNIIFTPSPVNRIETSYYMYGFKTTEGEKYNSAESAEDKILPGTTGILSIDAIPLYADYDFIEVSADKSLSLYQMVYNDEKTDSYPYEIYDKISYMTNGIRLANVSYSNNKYVYGKSGTYYVSITAPVDTLITSFTITVVAYKGSVRNSTEVFRVTHTLKTINLPVIALSYRGETNKAQELYIPKGVKDEIGVTLYNCDSEPTYEILLKSVQQPYTFASLTKENNKYYITIDKNATIGDEISIVFKASKTVNNIVKTTTSTINLVIVAYLIEDLGFENVVDNEMREQFGGEVLISLSYENSKFFYDETNDEITTMIKNDFEKLSGYDYNTWYINKPNGNSSNIAVSSYLLNDYIEIQTTSVISKSLYVSGVFYDDIESSQKQIGAFVKYYFDKSSRTWVFSKLSKIANSRTETEPYEFSSSKYVQNGRYYFEQSKFFYVNFYMSTSLEQAKPIYNVGEFVSMESGMSYILMRDLTLDKDNFTQISAQIAYLNGNNHTITIEDGCFDNIQSKSNIGIFSSISSSTIIENLKIYITASNLNVDATETTSVVYGTLASTNAGTIYNCQVSFNSNVYKTETASTVVHTIINGKEYSGTEEYINNIRLLANTEESTIDVTSGNEIPTSAKGIAVRITVISDGTSYVSSSMGVLVGKNTGYISNCRVENGAFHAYGKIGGLAGENSGTIASSYSLAQLNSYTSIETYSAVGGFVGSNTGKITLSFVESRDTSAVISAVCSAGGFVCSNSGTITNCYSSMGVNSHSSTAGFVFDNTKGTIENCYTTSKVREDSKKDMAFVGVNEYNELNNSVDGISSCYFLKGNYANQDDQPATKLNSDQFKNAESFVSFAFSDEKVEGGFVTSGTWFIPEKSSGTGAYIGQTFIVGRPTIVSANIISRGYVELLDTTIDEETNQITYNYSVMRGATLGSEEHPYVIYTSENLNDYIEESSTTSKVNEKRFILAKDINFTGSNKMAQTYYTNFQGKIEGNGMTINNLRLSYLKVLEDSKTNSESVNTTNFGMFKELNGATIQNLSLNPIEVYGAEVERVGVLAGTITSSKIYDITLSGDAVVIGKNLVGALAGFVSSGNDIKDITSSMKVSAVKREASINIRPANDTPNDFSQLAYAGGVFGYVADVSESNKSIIKSIKIDESLIVIGDIVGGVVGYLGKGNTLTNSKITVSKDMYIKGITAIGGIVGLNRGTVDIASVQYKTTVQNNLDNVTTVLEQGTKSGVGIISSSVNNDFFSVIVDSASNNSAYKVGITGGVVGINIGDVKNSFNKVNIVSASALYIGGLIGLCLSGTVDLCYASCLIDGGNKISSDERFYGGLIGFCLDYSKFESKSKLEAQFPVGWFNNGGKVEINIKNSNSIVTFNYKSYSTYQTTDIITGEDGGTKTYHTLGIGGVIGLIPETCNNLNITLTRVYYNKQIIDSGEASPTGKETKTIYDVGATYNDPDENSTNRNFVSNFKFNESWTTNTESVITVSKQNPITTNGISKNTLSGIGCLYVQMLTDGKKVESEEGYYSYKSLGDNVYGMKTQIFAPFMLSKYYEFSEDSSPSPTIKNTFEFANLTDLFSVDGNLIYLQGSDLTKVSLITNSEDDEWIKKYNGFYGYTFKLLSDYSLTTDWQSLGTNSIPFKASIDLNSHTISNINLNDNQKSFILSASGITIRNGAFRGKSNSGITVNVSSGNCGIIAEGVSIKLDTVSAIYDAVSAGNTSFGGFVGNLKGSYNNEIVNSYVQFTGKVTKLNGNIGGFACCSKNASITTKTSYCASTNSESINIPLVSGNDGVSVVARNVLVHNNGKKSQLCSGSNVTPKITRVFLSSTADSYENSYVYYTAIGNGDNSIFKKGYTIGNTTYKWKSESSEDDDNTIWKSGFWEIKDKNQFPTHSFNKELTTIFDGFGEYEESTRTYTLKNSLHLYNLSNAINDGTLVNGGDGYTFKLGENISDLKFATSDGVDYYIYDYDTSPYIVYEGVIRKITSSFYTDDKGVTTFKIKVTEGSIITFTVKDVALTAIGSSKTPFRGEFDGGGHTIGNITISSINCENRVSYSGLFGVVQDAVIQNVTLSDITYKISYVNDVNKLNEKSNYVYAGGIVGEALASEITDINIIGDNNKIIDTKIIKDNSEIALDNNVKIYVGGYVGFADIISIDNSTIKQNGQDTKQSTTINLKLTLSASGVQTENVKIGKFVGYIIRNQAYIRNSDSSTISISYNNIVPSKFGEIIENAYDDYEGVTNDSTSTNTSGTSSSKGGN